LGPNEGGVKLVVKKSLTKVRGKQEKS